MPKSKRPKKRQQAAARRATELRTTSSRRRERRLLPFLPLTNLQLLYVIGIVALVASLSIPLLLPSSQSSAPGPTIAPIESIATTEETPSPGVIIPPIATLAPPQSR